MRETQHVNQQPMQMHMCPREVMLKSCLFANDCKPSKEQTTIGQLGLLEKKFKLLEAWVRDYAQKQQDKLTKNLQEDLSETEAR